jgi:hypothetical protein
MPIFSMSPDRKHAGRYAVRLMFVIVVLAGPFLAGDARAQVAASSVPRQLPAQDARNAQGLTLLVAAASAGQLDTVKSLLAAGASVDATAADGRTPLIAAIQSNQIGVAQALIAAGAQLNLEARFIGSALNIAENDGNNQMAALLLASGAHTTGKSVGDTVCVRPWAGDGFCGTVKSFSVRSVQIQLTRVIGCTNGCGAREECSASASIGGSNGLKAGDQIAVPSWCMTQTGVKP